VAAAAEQAIEIDGRRFAWRSLGAGPRLVLDNGYGGAAVDWDPAFIGALAEHLEVLCPDTRGMGGSDLGDEELTIAAMAEDVEALMDALEIEACAVCGWSMGGYVSQALAEGSPFRVSALALIGTHPGGPGYVPTGDSESFAKLVDYSGTPREQASRLISVLFPPEQAAQIDAEFGELVAAARAKLDHRALDAQVAALVAWRDREPPPPLPEPPPAVILHGRLDRLVSAGNAVPLGERWGARVDVFEASAHAAMAQEPQRAAAAILEVAS
jgi:pimeloyl-ACP methyl ester carboxylesterase